MIRKGAHADIPRCLEMGQQFHAESGLVEIEFDADSLARILALLIEGDDGALYVAEVDGRLIGMAGALAYPSYFNEMAKVAQELFWWVEPEHRGGTSGIRMLSHLEGWAHSIGCATLTMICLPIDSPAEDIYKRSGYRALERSYIKRL